MQASSNPDIYSVSYDVLLDTWIVTPTADGLACTGASGSSGSESLKLGPTDDEILIQQPACDAYRASSTDSEWNLKGYRPALDGDFYDHLIKGCSW